MIIREEFDTLITQLLQCWHRGRHDPTPDAMEHWHYGLVSHTQLLHFLEDVRERVMYRHCQEDYEAMASPHLLDDRDDSEHYTMTKSRANMIAKYRFAEMTEEGIQPKTCNNNMFKAAKLQEELAFTKLSEDGVYHSRWHDTEAQIFEAMLDQLEKIDLDRCHQEFPLQYDVTRDAIQRRGWSFDIDDRDDSEHLNKAIQRGGWGSDIAEQAG